MNHKGHWLGTFFKINLDKHRKIDWSGTWTCDLRIDVPGLYQQSYLARAKGQYMVSWLLTGAPPNKDIDKIGRPPI